MVRPTKQSRSARRLVQTCALAVIPLLFSACTAAVPGVPATNAPIALATPTKSAVTKPPSTKGVTTKGGAAAGAVGAKTGTTTSTNTGTNTAKTGTNSSSSTTGANTSKTGISTSTNTGTNTAKTGTNSSSSTAGANTSKTGISTSTNTGASTSSTAAGASKSSTSAAPAASAAAGELVILRPNGTHGKMLTDAKGMTLYVFDKDSKDKSTCTGDCLTKWPPFTVANAGAAMKAAAGVTGKLGTIKRDDGKLQVTINGMPLYYFAQDKQAGDAKGQAVGNVWWEVGANGSKLTQ
jgi:predicted lipoprotein with Yx(FWY)xxD motif